MCKFFSLISDGKGYPYYFNKDIRKDIISSKLKRYELDSHTSIARKYERAGSMELNDILEELKK